MKLALKLCDVRVTGMDQRDSVVKELSDVINKKNLLDIVNPDAVLHRYPLELYDQLPHTYIPGGEAYYIKVMLVQLLLLMMMMLIVMMMMMMMMMIVIVMMMMVMMSDVDVDDDDDNDNDTCDVIINIIILSYAYNGYVHYIQLI